MFFAALALSLLFSGAAAAADWTFYGSARVGTWWINNGEGGDTVVDGAATSASAFSNPTTGHSDFDLDHGLQSNARVGMHVLSGDVTARVEYGASGGDVNTRILQATWNTGMGSLLVGQDYTPISWTWYSNQVAFSDEGLLGLGLMYAGRQPMIQYSLGGFKLALVKPTTGKGVDLSGAELDTDVVLPKIEMAYRYSRDNWFLDIGAGVQSCEYTELDDADGHSVTSWVVGAGGGYTFGPWYVKLQLSYDQNGAAYGLARYAPIGSAAVGSSTIEFYPHTANYDKLTKEFSDVSRFGGALVAGGQINDMVRVEAGLSGQQYSSEYGVFDVENTTYAMYLQLPFTPTPGVTISPEIGYMDWGSVDMSITSSSFVQEQSKDRGDTFYAGLQTRIDF